MRNAWLLIALAGCTGTETPTAQIHVQTNDSECQELGDCELATGTDAAVYAYVDDSNISFALTQVETIPAGIVNATLGDHNALTLHGVAAGFAVVHMTFVGGSSTVTFDRELNVADIGSTTIDPDKYVFTVPSGAEHFATYANYQIQLFVDYRARNGLPLVGHGLENWTITNGTLEADPESSEPRAEGDYDRTRVVDVGSLPAAIAVSTNGVTVALDVVAPGAAASLSLIDSLHHELSASATVSGANRTTLALLQRTSDGAALLANATPPTITVDIPSVLDLDYSNGQLVATGKVYGTTQVQLAQDGASAMFQFTVE